LRIVAVLMVVFLLGLGFLARAVLFDAGETRGRVRASLSVQDFMGPRASQGFRRAMEPRDFRFPEDHGPHPEFRTEWWYLTGNLTGPEGEPYGFQFTIFRSALSPEGGRSGEDRGTAGAETEGRGETPGPVASPAGEASPAEESPWRTNQLYMGHFAVTDVEDGRHRAFEAFARGALGLAGARSAPFRVWMGEWEILGEGDGQGGATGVFPLRLRGNGDGVALDLRLQAEKPMVLQGREGLSQKGPEPGNASYYYSFTRLSASGVLLLDGDSVSVNGSAWMDREWSTSALSSGQVGWDWFALQLEDGHDLMYYQLRRDDGTADTLSKGVWVDPSGDARPLSLEEVALSVADEWTSDLDGTVYPSTWLMEIPDLDLALEILPVMPDQEMDLTFRYWEGAVGVSGTRAGVPVRGVGYVELTGYSDVGAASPETRRMGRTGGGSR